MEKLEKKNIRDILALTPMQEGMLFHYLNDPESDHYFEQLSLKISDEINLQRFKKAWDYVVQGNEMLRVLFRWERLDNPTQVVLKQHHPDSRFFDLSTIEDHTERQKQLEKIKLEDRKEKFDLREIPFRVILCKISEKEYYIVISNHHILYDGWSTGVVLKEFFQAYEGLEKGETGLTTKIKPSFREYIQWHQNRDQDKQKKFWELYFKGFDAQTVLPIKRKGIKRNSEGAAAKAFGFVLEKDIKDKLDIFLRERGVTLAAYFYCAWGILLQKYCNSEDVVFGTTVSGRSAPIKEIENMVGLFINTIPLRVTAERGEKALDLLLKINNHLPHREKYENTPLVEIKKYSALTSGEELFDSLLVIENYPLDHFLRRENKTLPLTVHSYSAVESTNYDLTITIALPGNVEIRLIYNEELFAENVIHRLSRHFINILNEITGHPQKQFHEIEILSQEEKKQLLVDFNDTNEVVDYPGEKSIHQLFEEQVERTPGRIAVIGNRQSVVGKTENMHLTYEGLNERSNRLAHLLRQKGAGSDSIVGIMVERSIEMVIGIFGILKAGSAYLPIVPGSPPGRVKYMLADSGAKILATTPGFRVKAEIEVEELFSTLTLTAISTSTSGQASSAASLAYVLYTSGSTGRPKGVMVEHCSVINLLFALHHQYPLKKQDTYLLKTSYLFDVSVTELFGWFLEGGRLAILEKGGEKDPAKITDIIERTGVTHINFVPSMFNVFVQELTSLDTVRLSGLKYIFLAGEALLPELVNKSRNLGTIGTLIPLENIYGPTEGTVYSSGYSLANWDGTGRIPIGKPLPNMMLFVLDKNNCLQPIGVPGELCIGGLGVARGYLNRPGLTAERFVEPVEPVTGNRCRWEATSNKKFLRGAGAVFSKSAPARRRHKIYKTGDLARWLSDGNIEYLGRMDHQVKIRGFRIELGEIENQLVSHRKVKEAVVAAKEIEGGDKYLCAYIIPAGTVETALFIGQLREYLSRALPDYMIPTHFVTIDGIPLTPSGKIDRKALPEPEIKSLEEYTAPRNEREKALVDIWAEVLGIDNKQIGIEDNFFELGGHSLKIASLIGRIHKKLNIEIPFNKIFQAPTVKVLAEYISKQERSQYVEISPLEKREYYALSSPQKRLFVLQQMEADSIAYNMHGMMLLEGFIAREKFAVIFRQLIARHESLRTSFHMVNEEPVQRIHDEVEFEEEPFGQINAYNFIRPFDLSQPPLVRLGLIKEEEQKYLLMVDMHHIISDGISTEVFVKEFMCLYKGEELPGLRIQYKDFSGWQDSKAHQEALKKEEQYWLDQMKEEIPYLNLPTDFTR
ncbi:MAG: amino acid adenylation domain-containing protein, partial [Candidatus Aminicenantes bacterium]